MGHKIVSSHLGVDATIDSDGTYKGLPISISHDAHQVILGSNAVAEGVDAVKRNEGAGNEVNRVFRTFKEASEFAKRQPGAGIVRDESGTVCRQVICL